MAGGQIWTRNLFSDDGLVLGGRFVLELLLALGGGVSSCLGDGVGPFSKLGAGNGDSDGVVSRERRCIMLVANAEGGGFGSM